MEKPLIGSFPLHIGVLDSKVIGNCLRKNSCLKTRRPACVSSPSDNRIPRARQMLTGISLLTGPGPMLIKRQPGGLKPEELLAR